MLLNRILTAIPLAAVVIWLILYQPTSSILYALLLISAVSGYEWAHLSGVQAILPCAGFSILTVAVSFFFLYMLQDYSLIIISVAVLLWTVLAFYLFKTRPEEKRGVLSPVKVLTGLFIIPVAMLSISMLHSVKEGPHWLLIALMFVWVADIGAYFSGRKFGKTKLAQHISPGKTIEGVYGAVIANLLFACAVSYFLSLNATGTVVLLILSIVVTFISIVGDLYESVLKREAGLKDSGSILPGHGGILDRIDGVLSAIPVFYAGFYWLLLPLVTT